MKLWEKTPDFNQYEVYLNGVKMDNVMEADEELGRVWTRITPAYKGDVDYLVHRGTVEIRKKKPIEYIDYSAVRGIF